MVSSDKYQAVTGDVRQGVQVKAIDRGYMSLPIKPPTKTASWENLNELELLNSAGRTLQETQLPSTAHMSFSNGMGCLSMCNMDSREGQMGTYVSCNNVQGEAVQTLHLMNPLYSGHGDYASHADMVLVHDAAAAVGQDDPVSHSLQQPYCNFSSSPSLTQSISHQSTINSVHSTALVPKSNLQQTSLLLGGLGSSTWGAVNELSFLPLNDRARLTQPLGARLACMEPGQQQPSSSLSQLIMRPEPDEQGSIFHHGTALGLTADNPRSSPGSNQGLSLSLSAHCNPFQLQWFGMQPAATLVSNSQGFLQGLSEEGSRDDGYPQRWVGNTDQLKVNSHNNNHFLPTCRLSGLDPNNRQLPLEIISQAAPIFRGYLTGSKYLKAAQVLLEDVVGQGCQMKDSSKHMVPQPWIGGGSLLDSSTSNAGNAAYESGGIPKEGVACVVSVKQNALTSSSCEQKLGVVECNSQDNQEIQLKKAKLTAMLDEVDRRYKLYFSQMEAVANTFESVAGLGAAKTYTILALQTISKHFHGLRDAIGSQIQVASRGLGEDDSSLLGQGRLCYVDQQLRHQQAVHQFKMMPQHAWRPQRGLPERSVSVLKAWLFDHFLHPYPKDADKHMLARQTGLSRSQVSNWFINARVRLWKPLIYEMCLEEVKGSEKDRTSAETSADQKANTETSDHYRNGTTSMDDRVVLAVSDSGNAHSCEVGSKNVRVIHSDKQVVPHYQSPDSSVLQHSSGLDGGEGQLLQGIMKGKSAGMFSLYYQGLQTEDPRRKATLESRGIHDFRSREVNYPLYGSYLDQQEGSSRLLSGYNGYNGVSLTLGLQHPESVSHAAAQQQLYVSQQQNLLQSFGVTGGLFPEVAITGSRQRLDDVDQLSIDNTKDYEELEEMQTRKRSASNLYRRG